jgi:type I restriction enzyme S subunit
MTRFKAFEFPLAPRAVQDEIVDTLDSFSRAERELSHELETEIAARSTQHSHVRRTLLALPEAPREALGELVENLDSRRRPVTRADRTIGTIPYYGANGIQDHVDGYLFDGSFLLMGEDGSVTQKDGTPVVNWASGKVWVNNHAHVLAEKPDQVLLRYLYHYLRTVDIRDYVTGGLQPKLNQGNLNRIQVAVPSVPEQRRLIDVLDRMDAATDGLVDSLTKEREARRRQYEHSRSQLLAFEGAST